jgi:spore coat polysaccharide biosynthesis protein SpsF
MIVAAIQARTGSTRLPRKVVTDIYEGETLLGMIVERVKPSRRVDRLIVATTEHAGDDAVCAVARAKSIDCFRGADEDVLDRFYRAVLPHRPETVVRLTGDNPLVDAGFVDTVIDEFQRSGADYADTTSSQTFPLGMSVEVFSFHALEIAWKETEGPWREHVTPFIYRQPDRFRLHHIVSDRPAHHLRVTVDAPEDLALIRHVFAAAGGKLIQWTEAIELIEKHPEWQQINRHVTQRSL